MVFTCWGALDIALCMVNAPNKDPTTTPWFSSFYLRNRSENTPTPLHNCWTEAGSAVRLDLGDCFNDTQRELLRGLELISGSGKTIYTLVAFWSLLNE